MCKSAGVNIYAACFLIPMGVVVYTSVGGLKVSSCQSVHVCELC